MKATPQWATELIEQFNHARALCNMSPYARAVTYSGGHWFRNHFDGRMGSSFPLSRKELERDIAGLLARAARETAERQAKIVEAEERAYWAARGITTGVPCVQECYA